MTEFLPLADHRDFFYQLVGENLGEIVNIMTARIEPEGGGPLGGGHTHPHHHLFLVTEGQVRLKIGQEEKFAAKDESLQVDGSVLHSIWSNGPEAARVVIINYMPRK